MTLLENARVETRKAYRKIKKLGQNLEHQLASHHQLAEARKRLLGSPDYTAADKAVIGHVNLRIHPEDRMYHGDGMHYLESGYSGLRCIETSLRAAGKEPEDVRSILDFPCGHGRVLRFLQARFGGARILGAEINPGALDFCKRAFSIPPLRSRIPIGELELDETFDLIWCGSLLTHIDETSAAEVLRFFCGHLTPGGVCVFSTHGERVVGWMETRRHKFLLDEDGLDLVAARYRHGGYGYANYPFRDDYGISAVTRDHMRRIAADAGPWREAAFLDAGWDNCQDIYAYNLPPDA